MTLAVPTDRLCQAERPAVLVTSGAYSPVHRNHLLCLEAARAFFARPAPPGAVRGPGDGGAPLQVVGAYISALPDRMVARRRGSAIPRAHRTAMLRLATAGSDWVMVVDARRGGVRLIRAIAAAASAALGKPVVPVAVCGTDGYDASDGFLPADIPLACVRRPGDDPAWKALWEKASPRRRLSLIEDNHQPQARSATRVRALLRSGAHEALRGHLHPDVLQYLIDHDL